MSAAPSSQRGIAVVMLLLLVGLGLAALLAGSLHRQQGQAQMVGALRGNSEAQLRAWTGVDLTRQYLAGLSADQQKALETTGATVALNSGNAVLDQNIQIKLLKGDVSDGFITADITGLAADASSTVQAVFKLGSGGGNGGNPAVINLIGGLSTSGDITIKGGQNAVVQVHGDVNTSGNLNGASALNATGNISFSGQPPADGSLALWSNGNITVKSGRFLELKARGDIDMGGGSNVDRALANGKVSTRGDRVGTLWAGRDATLGSAVAVDKELKTQGSLDTSSSKPLALLRALGNLTLTGNVKILDGSVRGQLPPGVPNANVNVRQDATLDFKLPEVPAVNVDRPRIDANAYREQANYLVSAISAATDDGMEWKSVRVRVRNVSSIPDGNYVMGKAAAGQPVDSLCRAINNNGECGAPAYRVCDPDSACLKARGGAFTFDVRLEETLAHNAPGIWFFDGDATLRGRFRATILSRGNIETSGDSVVWSLQQAGAAQVCASAFPAPASHCDAQGKLKPQPVQAIALMAGSFQGDAFRGGDIKIGAMSRIYGNITAGNRVQTGGSSHIYGTVASALQSYTGALPSDIQNTLGAETVIDASQFGGGTSPTPPGGGGNGAKLWWTRYK